MKTKEQIFRFIKKQKVAFIASVDQDGFPNMKAMLMPRKIQGNCFYFSTNTSSIRANQYEKMKRHVFTSFIKGFFAMKALCLSARWK